MLVGVLVSAASLAAILPYSASAAGESYSWKNDGIITAKGGIYGSSVDITVDGQLASGASTLHKDSETYCQASVSLTVSDDNTSATYTRAIVSNVASEPGSKPTFSCSSSEISAIEALSGTTVQINGKRSSSDAETPQQKQIGVFVSNSKKKSDSPKSLVVTLKNSSGKEIDKFTTNIGDNGQYYGEFRNVKPGKYTVCVDKIAADKCKSVEKVQFERATVDFGELSAVQSIKVNIEAQVIPDDPSADQTFGPYAVELRKGGDVVQSKDTELLYSGCIRSCDGGTNIYTLKDTFDYKSVSPDDYKVCLGDRCESVKKVEGQPAEVTLKLNQDDLNNADPVSDTSVTTCAIDGVGWLICPVFNFMAEIIEKAYGQVSDWLEVTPITTNGGGTAMYTAWGTMRNIANIAFVIAFLIIIYSQITSIGLSNYGIKKLLPKIFMAAILVNISYWVCSIAVDISNIVGSSLYSLLKAESFTKGIDTSQFAGDTWSTGLTGWTGLVQGILSTAAIVYFALPALIIALPAALLSIITVFLVLALRQVLIILLIVISPLAFVALLLPNTENWFKKWRSLFQAMLVMYPIISVLFGASYMASVIVMNSATDVEGDGKIAVQLMGALITVLPLVLTPVIMKTSSGLLNRFAGVVNNPNRGPFDALRKRTSALGGRIQDRRGGNAIARSRGLLKSEGGVLGASHSKRRRVAAVMASGGRSLGVDAAKKSEYAKAGKEAAERGYFAERAVNDGGYATKIGGGGEDMKTLVQAYGTQAVKEERMKDIKAGTALIDHLDNATVAKIAATGEHEGKPVSAAIFQAATHRIQDSGSFDERRENLEFLAKNKTTDLGKALGMDATLRGEAAQKAIARGDSKIYGAGFGNELVNENGSIVDGASLAQSAVDNASKGSLNAQHLVQGDASTKFLVDQITGSTSQSAKANLKAAADVARTQSSTAAGITDKIDQALQKAGSYSASNPQPFIGPQPAPAPAPQGKTTASFNRGGGPPTP